VLNLKVKFVPFADDHNSYGKGFLVLVEDGWDFLIEGCISNIMSNNKFKNAFCCNAQMMSLISATSFENHCDSSKSRIWEI